MFGIRTRLIIISGNLLQFCQIDNAVQMSFFRMWQKLPLKGDFFNYYLIFDINIRSFYANFQLPYHNFLSIFGSSGFKTLLKLFISEYAYMYLFYCGLCCIVIGWFSSIQGSGRSIKLFCSPHTRWIDDVTCFSYFGIFPGQPGGLTLAPIT